REVFPPDQTRPGDVWVTNDPWKTSGHLLDLTVITPVFHGANLVAYFGNICHVADIGGRVFSADARELYEEGLFIPISRLFVEGQPNDQLFAIIENNVRAPREVVSELYSMMAANQVGAARLREFMVEQALETIEPLADSIIDRSDRAMREAIERVSDGTYHAQGDTDGFDDPIRLEVTIEIDGDRARVDFAGTSPESPRGINVVLNYTEAYTTFALKALLAPDVPNNEGSFRSVAVTAPEGCILNCRRPSPVAARHILGHFIPALIFRAMADAVPELMMAEGSANLWNTQFHGFRPDGSRFNLLFFNAGGTGARSGSDGLSSTAFPSGISGTPVEIIETRTPLVVLEKSLRPDSGGAGEYRGGLGHRLVIAGLRTDRPYSFSPFFDRVRFPARGLHQGKSGATGDYYLRHADGSIERPNPKATVYPDPSTELWIELPGGGGLGDPAKRFAELVARDLRTGLVSRTAAEEDYGFATMEENGTS
ncbi:MAG TPA: hydantoinase B/oxoprolinase family protein, partial [Chloroflexota bacterium]|nr:hydantoinase B/oxoprolinase family protein [Chloroflexota bacterium]